MIHIMAHCDICGYMIADITVHPDAQFHDRLADEIKILAQAFFMKISLFAVVVSRK